MASASNFTDFIQSRDAAGLQIFMSNERHLPVDHIQRNNEALLEACRDGDDEICEVLISFGADVNSSVYKQTPLFISCRNAHSACVDLLLSHGVNVNAVSLYDGTTPLIATASNSGTPVGLTLDQFIDNRCRCTRSLLATGVAIDQTDIIGSTALMRATWNFRLTEILIEAGANVNILDCTGDSALHNASRRNDADVVMFLLERGANIDARNVGGCTPLHLACDDISPAVVDSLIRYNADIDIVDNGDHTAFQMAMSRPSTYPNRVAVLLLIATCAQTRVEASSADWIRLARNVPK